MSLRTALSRISWVQRALAVGFVLAVVWSLWHTRSLTDRMVKDVILYVLIPGVLAITHRKELGWRVDRGAVKYTLALALFVLPFYVVGSSLPSVRAFYPMWGGTLDTFLPHAAKQFVVVVAAETYYRGLLCVGVRDIGRKAAFISPVIYAFHHLGKPPIELLLSGPTDVLFGLTDYEADSILPSVVAHGLGLALLDWLVLHDPLIPPETVVGWLRWLPLPL
ncbi:CPBP family glutamic-type intramembrane protease [Natronomonas sp. EA1]|uniref:CPBP family glutamic-type intramembrane protease n=1 Tax=Natronomonas sp. EA1 TaxID=3421655 RepID=UPI003EBFF8A6